MVVTVVNIHAHIPSVVNGTAGFAGQHGQVALTSVALGVGSVGSSWRTRRVSRRRSAPTATCLDSARRTLGSGPLGSRGTRRFAGTTTRRCSRRVWSSTSQSDDFAIHQSTAHRVCTGACMYPPASLMHQQHVLGVAPGQGLVCFDVL